MSFIPEKWRKSRVPDRSKKGFTLIEMLVVVAITAILAGIVLTYSSQGRTQVALYVEAAKLSQVILRAKSLAVSTYNDPDLPCGYGVHIDYATESYSLFNYRPADCSAAAIGSNTIQYDSEDNYNVMETDPLATGVVYGGGNSNTPQLVDIFFIPPDPDTLIWSEGDGAASNFASSVSLVSAANSKSGITVQVSPAGQITF